MKMKQKICVFLGFLVLAGSVITGEKMGNAQATETSYNTIKEAQTGNAGIKKMAAKPGFDVNLVENDHKGIIVGDGVRLRKKPNKTATILELMYDGERVYVYPQISAEDGNGNWVYIRRNKTDTTGWVSADCILIG